MPLKQVTFPAVRSLPYRDFYDGNICLKAIDIRYAIELLRYDGFCASERALAEMGYSPRRALSEDGNQHWVIVSK